MVALQPETCTRDSARHSLPTSAGSLLLSCILDADARAIGLNGRRSGPEVPSFEIRLR